MILSTHILPEVESVCDRVQILHHGSTVFSDTITALNQFQGGSTMCSDSGIRHRPPTSRPFAAWPARAGSDGVFRVGFCGDADPTDELVRCAVEHGWGLYQPAPAQASLEDVFST